MRDHVRAPQQRRIEKRLHVVQRALISNSVTSVPARLDAARIVSTIRRLHIGTETREPVRGAVALIALDQIAVRVVDVIPIIPRRCGRHV